MQQLVHTYPAARPAATARAWGPTARLLAGAAVSAAVTGALGLRAVVLGRDLATQVRGRPAWEVGVLSVEDLVEVAAVLIGLAVAAWFTLGLVTVCVCAVARGVGRRWTVGERLVLRIAPAVVRRALAVSVGTGVALAAVTVPAVALADDPVDLGWSATVTQAPLPSAGTASTAPVGEVPAPARSRVATSAAAAPAPGAAATATAGSSAVATEGPSSSTSATSSGGAGLRPEGRTAPAPAPWTTTAPSAPDPADTSVAAIPTGPPVATTAGDSSARSPVAPAQASTSPAADPPAMTTPSTTPTSGSTAQSAGEPTLPSDGGPPPAPASVTVERGDTLWAIAWATLPDGATVADIAAAWPTWYRANVDVIGSDPDLLLPGQQLRHPSAADGGARP